MAFVIYDLAVGAGRLALAPLPGGAAALAADVVVISDWQADLVISATQPAEMRDLGAGRLAEALAVAGIAWQPFAVGDFDVPNSETEAEWLGIQARAQEILAAGGRILVHCRGGCGRSGMLALRLMLACGEAPGAALTRLRTVRPCAVETPAQLAWANDVLQP